MAQYNVKTDEYNKGGDTLFEVFIASNKNGIISDTNPLSTKPGGGAGSTGLGQLRVSDWRLLGEYRFMYDTGVDTETVTHTVGGGTLVPDYTTTTALAQLGTTSGDRVVYQSRQYHPYIPGSSNVALMTFKFGAAKENLVQSVGVFDNLNGIFLRMNELVPEVVIRKNGVEVVVPQTNWNQDMLDGTGPSGKIIDWTKVQMLSIDYHWLGAGQVRISFEIDGNILCAHRFTHSNEIDEPYIFQPSLPVRWEVENIGVTASTSALMVISGAVYVEGLETESGFIRSVSTPAQITVDNPTGQCIVAVKLKDLISGKLNQSFARLKAWNVVSNNEVRYKVIIFNDTSKLVSPTWNTIDGKSWCEYAIDVDLTTGWNNTEDFLVIVDDIVSGGENNSFGMSTMNSLDNRSSAIYQNFDSTDSQVAAIVAYNIGVNTPVYASLQWIEIK